MPEGVTLEISGVRLQNLVRFNFSWCYYGLDYRGRQGKFVARRLCVVVGDVHLKYFRLLYLSFCDIRLKLPFYYYLERCQSGLSSSLGKAV